MGTSAKTEWIRYLYTLSMCTLRTKNCVSNEATIYQIHQPKCSSHFFGIKFLPLFFKSVPHPPPQLHGESSFQYTGNPFSPLGWKGDRNKLRKAMFKHPSRSPDWQRLLGAFLFGARYPAWWSDAERQDDWRPRIDTVSRSKVAKDEEQNRVGNKDHNLVIQSDLFGMVKWPILRG